MISLKFGFIMSGPVRSQPSLFGTCGWPLAGAEPRSRWEREVQNWPAGGKLVRCGNWWVCDWRVIERVGVRQGQRKRGCGSPALSHQAKIIKAREWGDQILSTCHPHNNVLSILTHHPACGNYRCTGGQAPGRLWVENPPGHRLWGCLSRTPAVPLGTVWAHAWARICGFGGAGRQVGVISDFCASACVERECVDPLPPQRKGTRRALCPDSEPVPRVIVPEARHGRLGRWLPIVRGPGQTRRSNTVGRTKPPKN